MLANIMYYQRARPYIDSAYKFGRALGYSIAMGEARKAVYRTGNKILSTNNAMPFNTTSTYRSRKARSSRVSSKKKQYKRTTPRRRLSRRQRLGPRPKSLRKKVQQITRQLNADSARHVHKNIHCYDLTCGVNAVSYSNLDVATGTQIESMLANLRYYDPSAPGTLVTAAGATGTYSRDFHFKNINAYIELRNNYQVPCKVKVYLVKPKGDTNLSPSTYYSNSIADQVIGGAATSTTPQVYPTDLTAFMQQWTCKCVKDVVLDAGSTIIVSHNTGSFKYDPSLFDSHALEYQKKFKSFSFFVRLEGVIGHDTVADENTSLPAGVTCQYHLRAEIIYDAGINLDDIYLNNQRSASFTNSGVVTNKPIADNQAYSVA